MEWNHDRKQEKEAEILEMTASYLRSAGIDEDHVKATAQEFLNNAIRITPPEKESQIIHMVRMAPSGRGGGRSTKAGNIRLNIRTLFEAISSGVFTVVSVTDNHWSIPFAALLLWNSIWKNLEVQLSEAEAVTLWVMWQIKDENKNVNQTNIKPAVEKHAEKYQMQVLSESDIKYALENLRKIGCIKPSKGMRDHWWLCEWVSPSYR